MDKLKQKIGIVGGGQLGKMMILEAKKMGFYVNVLENESDCPAASICDNLIIGSLKDQEAILKLAAISDVVTYDIEHINVEALFEIEKMGKPVFPTPSSLKVIQNKLTQKQTLLEKGAPVPEFLPVNSVNDIIKAGSIFGYPMMLKACLGGYDGRGNFLVKNASQSQEAYEALGGNASPMMIEKFVDFKLEASVLACRARNGEIAIYPVAQNNHKNEVLDETIVPAAINDKAKNAAMAVARQVMEIFEGVGMFCVEMFVTQNDEILVNEIAPRPHNSGHYTIEGCVTSQFANHIRAVAGLPLGDTSLIKPSVMRNLLGEPGYSGPTLAKGAEDVLSIKGASLHIYGKKETRQKRKMGHITVIADTIEEAIEKAQTAFNSIKIISESEAKQ